MAVKMMGFTMAFLRVDKGRSVLLVCFAIAMLTLLVQGVSDTSTQLSRQPLSLQIAERDMLIMWIASHVIVFVPAALVLRAVQASVASDGAVGNSSSEPTGGGVTATVHSSFVWNTMLPVLAIVAVCITQVSTGGDAVSPGAALALSGLASVCAIDVVTRSALLYMFKDQQMHSQRMAVLMVLTAVLTCVPGLLSTVLDFRFFVFAAPVSLLAWAPGFAGALSPTSCTARPISFCVRETAAGEPQPMQVWFSLPPFAPTMVAAAQESASVHSSTFIVTFLVSCSMAVAVQAISLVEWACIMDAAPGGWAGAGFRPHWSPEVREALYGPGGCRYRQTTLGGGHDTLMVTLVYFSCCLATILITIVARLVTLLRVRTQHVTQMHTQSQAMLRWLSHECRSPAAVALLVVDNMKNTTLPGMRAIVGGSGPTGLPSPSAPSSASRLSFSPTPAAPRLALGDSGPGDSKGGPGPGRSGRVAELYELLEKDVTSIEQPLTMLSGVLDNMLVYLRSTRSGPRHRGGVLEEAEVDLGGAFADFFELMPHLVQSYEARLPKVQGVVVCQAPGMVPSVSRGVSALEGLAESECPIQSPVSSATVKQVLVNLFTNALKYGASQDAAGERIILRISASLKFEETPTSSRLGLAPEAGPPTTTGGALFPIRVTISVKDQGRGMRPEEMESLFAPFSRLRAGQEQQGTGLGLWLMRELLQGQGGDLDVQSEGLGTGCTFTLTFPAHATLTVMQSLGDRCLARKTTSAALPETVKRSFGSLARLAASPGSRSGSISGFHSPSRAPLRVLLVDDSKPLRQQMKRALQRLGCVVLTAVDGQDALRVLEELEEPLQCMLCDMSMPVLDGPGVVRELRSREAAGQFFAERVAGGGLSAPLHSTGRSSVGKTAPPALAVVGQDDGASGSGLASASRGHDHPGWTVAAASPIMLRAQSAPVADGQATPSLPHSVSADEPGAALSPGVPLAGGQTHAARAVGFSAMPVLDDSEPNSALSRPGLLPPGTGTAPAGVAKSGPASVLSSDSGSTSRPGASDMYAPCRLPVIGLTGNALAEDVAMFKTAGADAVLTKPARPEIILLTVQKVMKKSRRGVKRAV